MDHESRTLAPAPGTRIEHGLQNQQDFTPPMHGSSPSDTTPAGGGGQTSETQRNGRPARLPPPPTAVRASSAVPSWCSRSSFRRSGSATRPPSWKPRGGRRPRRLDGSVASTGEDRDREARWPLEELLTLGAQDGAAPRMDQALGAGLLPPSPNTKKRPHGLRVSLVTIVHLPGQAAGDRFCSSRRRALQREVDEYRRQMETSSVERGASEAQRTS